MCEEKLIHIQGQSGLNPWKKEAWETFLKQQTSFLILDDPAHPKGYLIAQNLFPEIDIIEIAVLPDHQNKGIGTKLLEEILLYATKQSYESIFLEVSEHNVSARHLYQKMGFVQVGTRAKYYTTKENRAADALVLAWTNPEI